MYKKCALITFFLILSTLFAKQAWSNESESISLTKPSQSGHTIEETVFNIPKKKSTPTDIRKKKMAAKEEANYGQQTASKFSKGVIDIVTSVIEIPKTMIKTSETDGLLSGLTVGFAKGIVNTTSQAVSGAVNVATFPVPHEIENPMKPKKSNIENMDMEKEFGAAFESKPKSAKASNEN